MNILVTGTKGYIGGEYGKMVKRDHQNITLEYIDLKSPEWINKDFSKYDCIIHLAGIAHVSRDISKSDLYYKINTDLTEKVAKKAKESGVRHFVFMSSIIVYGSKTKEIGPDTPESPDDFYGDSKLQAEKRLLQLTSHDFIVTIIRSPMVYGKESKGNFPRLVKLARITPLFPNYSNKRSMIYVGNLISVIQGVIDDRVDGLIFPQNVEYVSTSNLVKEISNLTNSKIALTKIFNPLINLLINKSIINKLFGDLYYNGEIQNAREYIKIGLVESLKETINE